jgi:hypothetical protein
VDGLGLESGGLWTRAQALQGLTRGVVDWKVASGAWQEPLPRVLTERDVVLTAEQWAWAAVLASGGAGQVWPTAEEPQLRLRAMACGRTAARYWGFPLVDDDDPATGAHDSNQLDVHVWDRGLGALVGQDGHELRRRRFRVEPHEIWRTRSGLVLTSRLATAVHCTQLLSHEAAVCVLDHGLHRHWFTEQDLAQEVARRAGHPGNRALRAAVEAADRRAESPHETLGRLLLLPHVPTLVPQVMLLGPDDKPIRRFDLGDDVVRFAVELDGKVAHAGELMAARDRGKDHLAAQQGWRVERGTWFDVRRRQQELIQRVLWGWHQQRNRAA